MRWSSRTSARRGTFVRVRVSGDSSDTIIKGRAAFLAPEMLMVPFSLLPPRMRMRSMKYPPIQTGPGARPAPHCNRANKHRWPNWGNPQSLGDLGDCLGARALAFRLARLALRALARRSLRGSAPVFFLFM